jgi:1,4-dihydroxy-2-naphthoate octaprenyltransferase
MSKIKFWIDAMRLRTLPLSVSGIIIGSGMAALLDKWDTLIFLFAILTTISFQILSNFSNDLGDSQKEVITTIGLDQKEQFKQDLFPKKK